MKKFIRAWTKLGEIVFRVLVLIWSLVNVFIGIVTLLVTAPLWLKVKRYEKLPDQIWYTMYKAIFLPFKLIAAEDRVLSIKIPTYGIKGRQGMTIEELIELMKNEQFFD